MSLGGFGVLMVLVMLLGQKVLVLSVYKLVLHILLLKLDRPRVVALSGPTQSLTHPDRKSVSPGQILSD